MSGIGTESSRGRVVWTMPTQTPMASGDEKPIPQCNWTLFRNLPKFDLRNGDEADVRPMIIKATVPEWSKWVPVDQLAAEDSGAATDAFIVSALHQVRQNAPEGMTEAQQRKVGIVLGASRATMTSHYRLAPSELIAGEITEPLLAASYDASRELQFTVKDHAKDVAELSKGLELDPVEQSVVAKMALIGLGIPAMQGYSLIMTGHHYLSDKASPSNRVTVPPEKAYLLTQDVKDWWVADQELLRDALFHKAGHPIQMQLKESVACDVRLPVMLQAAGAGACASRLPALESELRTANSFLTVMSSVRPAFQGFGGDVDPLALQDVVDVVKLFPMGSTYVGDDFIKALPDYVPEGVKTRRAALQWLGAVLQKNADIAAISYGFYCSMSEQAQMVGGVIAGDTLKTSFSLSKLRTQNMSSYMVGTSAFQDYNLAKNAQRMKGDWVAPKYFTQS